MKTALAIVLATVLALASAAWSQPSPSYNLPESGTIYETGPQGGWTTYRDHGRQWQKIGPEGYSQQTRIGNSYMKINPPDPRQDEEFNRLMDQMRHPGRY